MHPWCIEGRSIVSPSSSHGHPESDHTPWILPRARTREGQHQTKANKQGDRAGGACTGSLAETCAKEKEDSETQNLGLPSNPSVGRTNHGCTRRNRSNRAFTGIGKVHKNRRAGRATVKNDLSYRNGFPTMKRSFSPLMMCKRIVVVCVFLY